MATLARVPVDEVMRRVHDRVYREMTDQEVISALVHGLGRPTVARFTDTPDLKTITRWSLGRNKPGSDRLERLRHAAMAYFALQELGLTSTNAEQWFRGTNPLLEYAMPVDVLREGQYKLFLQAVRSHGAEQ